MQTEHPPSTSLASGPSSPGVLFFAFMQLALQGFGGVLPVARHALVEKRRWLTMDAFTDVLARSQALPGPNIVNVGVSLGARWFGLRGVFAALAGLMLVPFMLMMVLCAFYASFASTPEVAGALRGVAAVSAGLIIGTALRMTASPRMRSWRALFGVAAFVAVSVMRLSSVPVLLIAAPLSIVSAWWSQRVKKSRPLI